MGEERMKITLSSSGLNVVVPCALERELHPSSLTSSFSPASEGQAGT